MKKNCQTFLMLLTISTMNVEVCFANDFASEVVAYVEGTDLSIDWITGEEFNRSNAILGRPTVDTTGDDEEAPSIQAVPVVPVNAPFRSFELVTVGKGGQIVIKFDHRVLNDPLNPYGIDFLIFGNTFQNTSNGPWINEDPSLVIAGSGKWAECGLVSVSQDGNEWITFLTGPYADDFSPTLGRCYDTVNPDSSLNTLIWTNLWWGNPTDPTLPLPPSMSFTRFQGKTVAEIVRVYGKSAGGTGFDLSAVGLDWIQYVRIEDDGKGGTPEIDALADVAPRTPGDANLDGMVDVGDLGILAANYGSDLASWCMGDFTGDGCVDVGDLGVLAANYGQGVNHAVNFDADYAKAFGATVTQDNTTDPMEDIGSETCGLLGLPLVAGFLFTGLFLVRFDIKGNEI